MEIVLATNFDDALVEQARDLPVSSYFGGFPISLTGAGRPPHILPDISADRFRAHVEAIHRRGRKFIATVNSIDLGLREYEPGYLAAFVREMARLLDLGVDGFVVALPLLIEALHREYPEAEISASTFARIRSVTQGEHFLRLGARTLILEEANRDMDLVRGLVRAGARVEVLVNQTCLKDCPFRAHHLNTSSLASQPQRPRVEFEVPILECGMEFLRDPASILSGIFVRPEDLEFYEQAGVHRFKVSGRNRSTEWLLRSARAYAGRRYDGNLLDILSFVQVKGPSHALAAVRGANGESAKVEKLRKAFARLEDVRIDNRAIPSGFLRRIATTDCAHLSCKECGYCAGVASKVMTIGGRPLSEYRPPTDLPPAASMLPMFGSPPAQKGAA